MADFAQIKKRILESKNPHAELILERLDAIPQEESAPTPESQP